MEKYKFKTAVVIWRLKERGYSKTSIQKYRKIYASIENYLIENGLIYSPVLGEKMLAKNEDDFFKMSGLVLRKASIRKLNDVYLHGDIQDALLSPRREYGKLKLEKPFEDAITIFMKLIEPSFSASKLENTYRRISLFFKYVQSKGVYRIEEISYELITAYHNELSYLKTNSRENEESVVHQMLHFLSDKGRISKGRYLHLYLLEIGHPMMLSSFSPDDYKRLEHLRNKSSILSSECFLQKGTELVNQYHSAGYVDALCKTAERTILYLYLFLDLNNLGYSPELANIWLNSDTTKKLIVGSSWGTARRVLNVFKEMVLKGQIQFAKVYRGGISGLDEMPDWCKIPLMNFAKLRIKEKLKIGTVNNDIYSILRFLRFILQKGYQSFSEITGDDMAEFNLKDLHGSSGGKRACNARVRKFLKYLDHEGYASVENLSLLLPASVATKEKIVTIFTDEEIQKIRQYVDSARTPTEIRDSAIILLGCDMGIRGCDIVNLTLSDIDWKRQCIRFRQDKTDVDILLAMPTAVGNAIYKYLKDVRSRSTECDRLFISIHAPYKAITRCTCYEALHRILPNRSVAGSGFHTTRKTFSTNLFRNGVTPLLIADALGHTSVSSLTPYLSLDDQRMAICPLSLSELSIAMEGDFQ